jgi:hypothetical protein
MAKSAELSPEDVLVGTLMCNAGAGSLSLFQVMKVEERIEDKERVWYYYYMPGSVVSIDGDEITVRYWEPDVVSMCTLNTKCVLIQEGDLLWDVYHRQAVI